MMYLCGCVDTVINILAMGFLFTACRSKIDVDPGQTELEAEDWIGMALTILWIVMTMTQM